MNRERAMALLAQGERALEVYDGAKSAWNGFNTGKTASNLMAEGIGAIIGAEDPLSANFKAAQAGRTGSERAVFAILGGIMGVIFIPPFLKKGL